MTNLFVRVIRNDFDHKWALSEIDRLIEAENRNENEADYLKALTILVSSYEENKYPVGMPSIADAIEFAMDQMNYTIENVAKITGVDKLIIKCLINDGALPGLGVALKLHHKLGIPADVLLQQKDC